MSNEIQIFVCGFAATGKSAISQEIIQALTKAGFEVDFSSMDNEDLRLPDHHSQVLTSMRKKGTRIKVNEIQAGRSGTEQLVPEVYKQMESHKTVTYLPGTRRSAIISQPIEENCMCDVNSMCGVCYKSKTSGE